jgi:catechol 2,3-dioxygenase-like lactoylglutathione lyase family enzyme
MPSLENLKKQAKLVVRWHREGYHPVAQRIRHVLPRFRQSSDADILARRFTLSEAQELIAREHGFASWQALRSGLETMTDQASPPLAKANLSSAYPQVFVTDMTAAAAFFTDKLGFTLAFAYGEPPFYAQVRRNGARLNLRHVDGPVYNGDIRAREHLLAAHIAVEEVKDLYLEYQSAGVAMHQPLRKKPWGAQDFIVLDPDGNLIGFSSPTDLQD